MSVDKFKFVSPGVFINEIDRSVITGEGTDPTGPVIIGRSITGPAMYPTKVQTFQDFINLFGNPNPGQTTQDPWREGNHLAPTYAAYAAEAYLRGAVGPVTFIRTLGLEDPNADAAGKAGWDTTNSPNTTPEDNGGAYGLFVIPSGSTSALDANANALLAAIVYVNSGSVYLSGSAVSGTAAGSPPNGVETNQTGTAGFFQSVTNTPHDFTMMISGSTGITKKLFSLDDSRPNFIRSVLNTNAVNVNDDLVESDNLKEGEQYYWLGESFENAAVNHMTGTGNNFACLLPLDSGTIGREDMRHEMTHASTGWFFSQDMNADTASYNPANMTKLFKLQSISGGEWTQSNIKISIENMRYPRSSGEWASFTVVVRDLSDRDLKQSRLEVYSNCNLNSASPNYLAKKIGDIEQRWNTFTGRFEEFYEYANKSNYIRVVMSEEGTIGRDMLPFGFESAPYLAPAIATTSSVATTTLLTGADGSAMAYADGSSAAGLRLGTTNLSLTMSNPAIPFRDSVANSDAGNNTEAYFGVATYKNFESMQKDTLDYLRAYPANITTGNKLKQQLFSLDNLSASFDGDDDITGYVTYVSGSRTDGESISATKGWKEVIDEQLGSITTVLHGGFDGLNIKEIDHFANRNIDGSTMTELNSSALYTIQQTIEMVKDTTFLEMNAAAIPGITDTTLNNRLVNACEERADSLAVIDLPDVYFPRSEGKLYAAASKRFGTNTDTPTAAADTFETRALNSSYACTYYPWVNMKDTNYDQNFWAPPSVAALGTFASSENKSEIWFAPAGFNRGGLSEAPYAAGLPVTNVSKKLTSKERDSLYEVSINPIASFPSEGIVIFGQKTTQTQQSALDRINVRRMINFIKREVSKIASGILFDPNVQVTWERFLGETEPFLASIQSRLGLAGYKVVLDDTTTTPDLVDRNILYAKIFLKPARAIEFIAIDFIITRSGASFDD